MTRAAPTSRTARTARAALLVVILLGVVGAPAPVLATPAPSAPARASYGLPAPGAAVVRAFEAPPAPWAAGHRGVDLAAAVGSVVVTPAAGVVAFAGPVAGRGVVTVRHDDGLLSSLEPVTSAVEVGDRLDQGRPVGRLASGEHCDGSSCLHWGVRTGPDAYVDPMMLVVTDGPVVLLPP